jgi:hypothetical protein
MDIRRGSKEGHIGSEFHRIFYYRFFEKSVVNMKYFLWAVMPIAAECGEVLWSGFFNSSSTVKEFDECKKINMANSSWQAPF